MRFQSVDPSVTDAVAELLLLPPQDALGQGPGEGLAEDRLLDAAPVALAHALGLREAFTGALPERILWRQKEQFSDGVGYGWIDGLKAHAARCVGDAELAGAAERFPLNTPETKEAFLYRRIFEELFPGEAAARTVPGGKSIACSSPAAIAWDASFASRADPSGRAMREVHAATA